MKSVFENVPNHDIAIESTANQLLIIVSELQGFDAS
jgi:hypothetical protein